MKVKIRMHVPCRIGTVLSSAVLCCGTLLCQPASSMDLVKAYQAALSEDAQWRAAQAGAAAASERLPQAKAQWLPNVALSVARNHNDLERTQPNFLGNPTTTREDYFSYNESLTLRQPVFRPALRAALKQASFLVDEAQATLLTEKSNLAERVTGAYFEVLLAQDRLQVMTDRRQTDSVRLEAARKLLVAGAGTRTDIDEAQARLDLTSAQLLEARQQLDYSRHQLQTMLSMPLGDLQSLAQERSLPVMLTERSLAAWTEQALANNPQMRALQARVEAARLEVDKSKAGHLPTLDAVAQVSRSGSENTTSPSSSYFNRQLGLQLNVPLFAGGYVNSTVRQTAAQLTQAQENLEAGRRDLSERVHKQFRAVTEGVLRAKALEQALQSAQQMVTSNERSFAAGVRSLLDVAKAQDDRSAVLMDLAQARYVLVISMLRLQLLAGDEPQDVIASANQHLKVK